MFCSLLKKDLTFTLSRLETNNVSFSQVKFLVFEAQLVFSKLSEAASLDEQDRISITSTPSRLHYRTQNSKNKSVFVKVSNPCWFIISFKSRIYQASSKRFCKSSEARNLNCIAMYMVWQQ